MQININEQLNRKEKTNSFYDFNEVYSKGLEDIVLTCELRKNIGLTSSFNYIHEQKQSEEFITIYEHIIKFVKENVLNYQYQEIILNKLTFLFKYGEISSLKDHDNTIEIIGSVIGDIKESSIYTLGININDEKIVFSSMDGIEDESVFTIIEGIYKTSPQDNMSSYIKDISIRTKDYVDIDTPYETKNITKKFLALKEEDGNIITALKRKNTKETTTLLCGNYQGFKENRVVKEYKNSVTLWNGIGVNTGYVIGSYVDSTMEYGKKISGEEYYYVSRNNHPTLCDITPDFVKVPLNFLEFNAAIEGIALEKTTPISSLIREAEEEYTFGTLKKIESTKRFL